MSEATRSDIGNTATEQGADWSGVSVGSLPESRPDAIEVDAEYVAGDGVTLTPRKSSFGPDGLLTDARVEEYRKALGDLHEGPLDLLNAQLCEEPDEAMPSVGLVARSVNGIEVQGDRARLELVSRRSPREELVWYGMHPEYYGAVAGDRIMLRRDVLESQYSCKTCKAVGFDENVLCGNCGGSAHETVRNQVGDTATVPCRACRVMGFGKEVQYSCGRHRCSKCNGSGWRNGIVIPEESQTQAITGVVVSVGPDCRVWKIGDRLMFSRFAGHTLEVSKTESFIMMRESEALGMLRQRNEQ